MENPTLIQIGRHGVGGVFIQRDPNGQLSVLAHHYTKKDITTLRLPSGTGRGHESVLATLHREMREEVAAQSDDFEFRLVFSKPVYFELDRDDRTGKLTYLKAFFALEITRGRHRDVELIDDEGTPEEELLGPLDWHDIGDLVPHLTLRTHQCAVVATFLLMARLDVAIRNQYQQTWDSWERHTTAFQIENPIVIAYITHGF